MLALAGSASGPFFASAWPFALLAQLPMALYLMLLPLGYRATPPLLLVLAGALLVGVVGRPQAHRPGQGHNLTVLSWNVGVDVARLDRAARDLAELDWDLALLQEVGLTERHDVGRELLDRMPVPHAVRGGYEGELMILSRSHPLSEPTQFLAAGLREELTVEVELGTARLRVANLHLVRRDWNRATSLGDSARLRELQVSDVLAQGPFDLIGGDLNLPPASEPVARLREHYRDCFESAGWGFGMTYPRPVPLWRIDYLFARRELVATECRTLSLGASDHRALLTRLRIPALPR